MEKQHRYNFSLVVCRTAAIKLTLLVALGLGIQTVHAQSQCVKDENGVLICDLSVSLIERYAVSTDTIAERAWLPTNIEAKHIQEEFGFFSDVWCEITLGKSRIRKISIFTNNRKSSADMTLYKGIGRSYAVVGGFTRHKPSIVAYYSDFNELGSVDLYLGRVFAHEFSHAVLKVYDEYIEPGAKGPEACFHPLETDDPRDTIMNDHRRYTRYSHPDDYVGNPSAQTAQYRCYGESAWEILLQPDKCDSNLSRQVNAGFSRQDYFATGASCTPSSMPALASLEIARYTYEVNDCIIKARDALQIKFPLSSKNIITMIDSDIDGESKKAVANAVNITMNLLVADKNIRESDGTEYGVEKKIALVDFSESKTIVLRDIEQEMDDLTEDLKQIINNKPSRKRTINQNLSAAKAVFSDVSEPTESEDNIMIVISATETLPSVSALSFFKQNNIAIHAIGIGDTINPGLQTLATETGGEYFTITSGDPNQILNNKLAVFSALTVNPWGHSQAIIVNGGTEELTETARLGMKAVHFDLVWPLEENVTLDRFELRSPTGKIINPRTAELYPNKIYYRSSPNYRSYTVINPTDGKLFAEWRVIVGGSGAFEYDFKAKSSVTSDINAGTSLLPRITEDTAIVYPAPIPIRVRVQDDMPVLHTSVEAEVITPQGFVMPTELKIEDRGEAPDWVAEDGIYSGVISDYAEHGDGIYTIKAIIANTDGKAILNDTGVATFGSRYLPAAPRSAPPFYHTRYYQVEVKGSAAKLSNTDADNPHDIKTDGTLSWGAISESNQMNWYVFEADRSALYYIQTSNLIGYGDNQMETDVSLYEQHPSGGDHSFIATSSGHRGTEVSSIESTLDGGKKYLVSVSHVTDGRGVYALTVNSDNGLLSAYALSRTTRTGSGSGSGGGGGGGGIVDYLLLMLLTSFILYSIRPHRSAE